MKKSQDVPVRCSDIVSSRKVKLAGQLDGSISLIHTFAIIIIRVIQVVVWVISRLRI